MALIPGKDVLLFFEDVDRDTFFRNDRRVRRFLRKARNLVRRGKPRVSGFELWYLLLRKALLRAGCRVHTNAYGLARGSFVASAAWQALMAVKAALEEEERHAPVS